MILIHMYLSKIGNVHSARNGHILYITPIDNTFAYRVKGKAQTFENNVLTKIFGSTRDKI
jgi:hypothetical protein